MNTENKFELHTEPLFGYAAEGTISSAGNAGCPITSTFTTVTTGSYGCTTG